VKVKLELDENIPVLLVEALTSLGHDVQTVIGQGLTGRADAEIWRQCQLEDRLLMTQDLDFSDARKFEPGSHAGIVLVRLQNPGRVALFSSAGGCPRWNAQQFVCARLPALLSTCKAR
jgi:predicted nuclease of predicted toxin-antitoxin system